MDSLLDLEPNSQDIKFVFDKIKELDSKGKKLLALVPDNFATCSIQAKYYIKAIIQRAKEHCDNCVLKHLNEEDSANRKNLNVS